MKAQLLEQVAADAIRTAFHPTTPGFSGLIDRFLADRQRLTGAGAPRAHSAADPVPCR
ncbi:MAG: hypothetical protein ACKOPT_12095 [Cyanobium sp.]